MLTPVSTKLPFEPTNTANFTDPRIRHVPLVPELELAALKAIYCAVRSDRESKRKDAQDVFQLLSLKGAPDLVQDLKHDDWAGLWQRFAL
ncbi:hypothetical protein BJX61DRAFT_530363 [Aspergillus egyptiacus]|nr:hypothetical protein BJX61DRAFT_530363 [Aspergillus egyptiacus]